MEQFLADLEQHLNNVKQNVDENLEIDPGMTPPVCEKNFDTQVNLDLGGAAQTSPLGAGINAQELSQQSEREGMVQDRSAGLPEKNVDENLEIDPGMIPLDCEKNVAQESGDTRKKRKLIPVSSPSSLRGMVDDFPIEDVFVRGRYWSAIRFMQSGEQCFTIVPGMSSAISTSSSSRFEASFISELWARDSIEQLYCP